jgi:stage II sporulation protein D
MKIFRFCLGAIISIIGLSLTVAAQNINIGLFYKNQIKAVLFEPINGKFTITSEGNKVYDLNSDQVLYITIEGRMLRLKTIIKDIGLYERIVIESKPPTKWDLRLKRPIDSVHIFRLKPVDPDLPAQTYDEVLKVKVANDKLLLINDVEFDTYLAGVVEAESGPNALPEFYKAQACICRTYAVQNAQKHKGEDFQLCDDVDCQAFKGKNQKNPAIYQAVKSTHGMVIKDTDSTYINAVFSANCGGETTDAKDLWSVAKSYLIGQKDPHCVTERQATWIKKIPVTDWRAYFLSKKFNVTPSEPPNSFIFNQDNRKNDYLLKSGSIPFRILREDWKLRSAFFSVTTEDNYIVLKGRGYGHGVGMCQEGAMNMAKKGFLYDQIIKFYYRDVQLVKENF